eukprot:CAMPEP_0115535984 /NCGR_PEP_ID=MMETSP0271-20121206/87536_1 /TAXON_ID=71861 /ORGANISM="Scrippsiella trochoidea, Strain CCMP3099" /LENGTH=300 /DNA_ID=CAMNT_0002968649 /DNA_START=18 /DNA_END=915 /DNA_ORIENTATION=+
MPQKKPPRVAAPGDDTQAFTLEMRERLKALKLSEEKEAGEARAVSETKVDDLIAKEADDAKISGLYAMWYVDKERDRMKAEDENPDLDVLRKRYDQSLSRLDRDRRGPPEVGTRPQEVPKQDEPRSRGFFLEQVQQQSKMQDRVSKRVVKSPEERRQDYEDTKSSVSASTAFFGVVGTGAAAVLYGADGALAYLSGLSNYADNAETPMGQVMGGAPSARAGDPRACRHAVGEDPAPDPRTRRHRINADAPPSHPRLLHVRRGEGGWRHDREVSEAADSQQKHLDPRGEGERNASCWGAPS